MKYVIFKFKTVLMPVLTPEHTTHSQLQVKGAKPVSAGFFYINSGEVIVTDEGSESLNLKPEKERDKKLIESTLINSGMYAFLDI